MRGTFQPHLSAQYMRLVIFRLPSVPYRGFDKTSNPYKLEPLYMAYESLGNDSVWRLGCFYKDDN
jgi:hypothetical protein